MKSIIKILTIGGTVSPGELEVLATAAQMHQGNSISFGSRQEIYISCPEVEITPLTKRLESLGFQCEIDLNKHSNIVTSFAAVGIYPSTIWVTGDTFFDVLEEFNYLPQLKINITDPVQRLIPSFTGHLNFVASNHRNYWFLYINLPGSLQRELWPGLIYIDEVAPLSKRIEELYYSEKASNLNQLFDKIGNETIKNSRSIDKDLILAKRSIPYYEGMNPIGNVYWLGIYRRDYQYSLQFILDVCELCKESKMGKISITTWKTILIKDIKESERMKWEVLLGKHGINIRHSSLELHWNIPDLDEDALNLKNQLVNFFDKKDIRTYGVCFAISDGNEDTFGNVIIEKNEYTGKYAVHHTPDFNLFTNEQITVAQGIQEEMLVQIVQELCQQYYKLISETESDSKHKQKPINKKLILRTFDLFQCKHCLTIYNQEVGDTINEIPSGVPFETLLDSYNCPVCDGSKNDYVKLADDFSVN